MGLFNVFFKNSGHNLLCRKDSKQVYYEIIRQFNLNLKIYET